MVEGKLRGCEVVDDEIGRSGKREIENREQEKRRSGVG
jgi:hypothetical protein